MARANCRLMSTLSLWLGRLSRPDEDGQDSRRIYFARCKLVKKFTVVKTTRDTHLKHGNTPASVHSGNPNGCCVVDPLPRAYLCLGDAVQSEA